MKAELSEKAIRDKVEKLKQDWVKDPCWDIEDTEGFEGFREELQAFSRAMKLFWKSQAETALAAKAKLTCPLMSIMEGFNGGEMRCITSRCAWWSDKHGECNINLICRRR